MSKPEKQYGMSLAFTRNFIALAFTASCVAGCSGGKPPFRQVQFCLASATEIPVFTSFMDQIAQDDLMEFTDRSGQTGNELRALASDNKNVPVNDRAVNISAERGSEFGFGAGNTGLPVQQISIGFSSDNLETAKPLADAVVRKLSTKWRIYEVPQ